MNRYTNLQKYESLKRAYQTLSYKEEETDVVYYGRIIDQLENDFRSKEKVNRFKTYLIDDREDYDRNVLIEHYVTLLMQDEELVKLINSTYVTMYLYSSKIVGNSLVCNDVFKDALMKASLKYLKLHNKENSKYAKIKKIIEKALEVEYIDFYDDEIYQSKTKRLKIK